VLKNLNIKYQNAGTNAIKGINYKINGGTKIAIIGRTGSGKSSLVKALFRMVNIEN
jgi:ABC-type transport system involved in cytochrome bd biosynthesis fused ATPase/permease subunit